MVKIGNKITILKMLLIAIVTIALAACELFSPERSAVVALVSILGSILIDIGMPICLFICVGMMNIELPDSMQIVLLLYVTLVAIVILLKDVNKNIAYKDLALSLFVLGIIAVISYLVGYQSTIMYVIRSIYVFIVAFSIGFHFYGNNVKILSFAFLCGGLAVMGIVLFQLYTGAMQMEFDAETGRLTYGEQVRTLANVLAFPIYYSFIEYMQAIENKEYLKKIYWVFIALLGITLLLLTVSRGVIFAVAITLVFVYSSRLKDLRLSTVALISLFVVLIIYYVSTLELNTEYMFNKIGTLTGRDEIWGYYLGKVVDSGPIHFLFGFGPGDIKRLSVGTAFADAYEHSLFVGFFVSFGIIGFSYLLWVLYRIGKPLWRSKNKNGSGLFLLTILLFVPFGSALTPLFYYFIGFCLALSMSVNHYTNGRQITR